MALAAFSIEHGACLYPRLDIHLILVKGSPNHLRDCIDIELGLMTIPNDHML